MATTMFIRHKVSDYAKWKRGYDDFEPLRSGFGVTAASVHRDTTDPTVIIVTHQFKDAGAMMVFVNSEELKTGMANAGVMGIPEIWFGEDLEHTTP